MAARISKSTPIGTSASLFFLNGTSHPLCFLFHRIAGLYHTAIEKSYSISHIQFFWSRRFLFSSLLGKEQKDNCVTHTLAASRAVVRTSANNQDFPPSEILIFLLVGAVPNPPASVETSWLLVLKNAMIDAPRANGTHMYTITLHFRFPLWYKRKHFFDASAFGSAIIHSCIREVTYAAYAELSHDFRYISNPKKEILQAWKILSHRWSNHNSKINQT